LDEGSSVGLALLHTEDELATAMAQLTGPALCEAFVPGRECTVPWVLGQVLPVVEITPASGLYDHEAKYLRDDTVFTVEPGLTPEVQTALEKATTQMASSLDARHLGRADFILGPDGPVFLEWNAMPGFTASSLLPRAAAHVGIPLPDLTDRLVRAAHAEGPLVPIR
jgi:D-alanine-D-alanine ligase